MLKKGTVLLCLLLLTTGLFAEEAPPEVEDFVYESLVDYGGHPVIVDAVEQENALGKTLDEIKELDDMWKNTPGIADYMQVLMDSECAQVLLELQEEFPFIAEIFVMDNQGANVAMTDKTSDYWQGDEAKFENSYADGEGDVFIDEIEFDDSTQTYSVQVSFPVRDHEGRVIGAVTVGIDIDAFEGY